MTKPIALVAGATGLVGREILRLLAADEEIGEIRALVRRPLPETARSPRIRECRTDFGRLDEHPEWFRADRVFCALGTTLAKAGSRAAFRRVDFDYPLAIARAARAGGARHFLLVSALGANARSPIFYNRVKGELEAAVMTLGFPSLTIARPSLLIGERTEWRWGEEIAKRLAFLFPAPWRAVEAHRVAAALVGAARDDEPGLRFLDNAALCRESGG